MIDCSKRKGYTNCLRRGWFTYSIRMIKIMKITMNFLKLIIKNSGNDNIDNNK